MEWALAKIWEALFNMGKFLNIMSRLLATFILIFSVTAEATDDSSVQDDTYGETKSSITCKLLDLNVVGIQEGRSQRYRDMTDWAEDFSVGQNFNITIDYSRPSARIYYLNVRIPSINKYWGWSFNGVLNKRLGDVIFTEDLIFFREKHYAFYEFNMERYYKNDWQLILTGVERTTTFVVTANCKNMPSSYELLLKYISNIKLNNAWKDL